MCLCCCSSRCSILAVSFFRIPYSLINRPIGPMRAFVYIPAALSPCRNIKRVPALRTIKPWQQDPSLVRSCSHGCIMGLSYNLNTRVQTADKNITIIHTTPVHQLMSWEEKSWNKSIILLPPVKKCSGLNQERNLLRSSTVYQTKQSKTTLNKDVAGFWCERQQEMEEALL